MSIGSRKLFVAGAIAAIFAVANAGTIVGWLQDLGVIPLAQHIRSEYITGTAIAVIVALLLLLPGRAVRAISVRRCPVCDAAMVRRGKYCAECGARV
ncbi:MAG: hypothetical protein PVI86_09210 [Phycisphaerae bacterium]|jgi:hypothetical protein